MVAKPTGDSDHLGTIEDVIRPYRLAISGDVVNYYEGSHSTVARDETGGDW